MRGVAGGPVLWAPAASSLETCLSVRRAGRWEVTRGQLDNRMCGGSPRGGALLSAGSPSEEQTTAERMERFWKRIGAWYAKNNAPYAESLERTRPATPMRIATLEKALETELPPDFRAFLLRFGGGTPSGRGLSISEYDVLPVDQILDRWKGLEKLREEGVFAKVASRCVTEKALRG